MRKNTCKNCISWMRCVPLKYDTPNKNLQGECNHSSFIYSSDDCVAPTDGLVYWDAESYAAGFNTGEDFGCIHFRRRFEK